jgi:hypothetical protein
MYGDTVNCVISEAVNALFAGCVAGIVYYGSYAVYRELLRWQWTNGSEGNRCKHLLGRTV